jgi:hypothetical protein
VLETTGDLKVRSTACARVMHSDVRLNAEAIIREANLAFEFNGRLFQDVATAIRNIELSNYTPQSKLIFDASQEPQEKTYPVSSVVAVIMALVLAHFILVVGGFTGAKGAEKLESVMLWLRAVAGHS